MTSQNHDANPLASPPLLPAPSHSPTPGPPSPPSSSNSTNYPYQPVVVVVRVGREATTSDTYLHPPPPPLLASSGSRAASPTMLPAATATSPQIPPLAPSDAHDDHYLHFTHMSNNAELHHLAVTPPTRTLEGPCTTQLKLSANLGLFSFLFFLYCKIQWQLLFAPQTKLKDSFPMTHAHGTVLASNFQGLWLHTTTTSGQ
ncbi:hypothetical protein DFP72DRAFT_1077903 [Ephemerocybe angulata]|uniref:Uncharacterized protein n=1 Tax=Ephemerocybe angulata TaxID=980116 RepID=A0A8H6HDR6_9AGAR|nr:hypothetical protein DFP72DRAFT_1077903 [Tulosesus angulatus]